MADFAISPDMLKSETASAFAKANARSCAKMASILSHKGEGLISEKTWNEMHSEPLKELWGEMPGIKIIILYY